MKTLSHLALCIFILCGMQACNNPRSKDAVSIAKKANEAKDTTNYIDMQGLGTEEFPAIASLPYSDSDFAVNAADRNLLEIELGKISLTNSSNQEIKDFGQMMINDYTKANDELIALAKQKDIVLPPSPSQKNIKHIQDLIEKRGDNFDKHYLNLVISAHRNTINLFESAANNATDVDIKAFANNTLPILKKHFADAKALKDKF